MIDLNGKKTYILGVGWVMYGVGGFTAGQLDLNQAVAAVLAGLTAMGLRHGIQKLILEFQDPT